MPGKIDIDQSDNHIGGNFTWDTKPECCKNLIDAVEVDKFVFVSNFVFKIEEIPYNLFYMLPVDSGGHLEKSKGITIQNCPWCGVVIRGSKKYPKG